MKSIILVGIIWAFNFSEVANKDDKSCVDGGSVSINFQFGNGSTCSGMGICRFGLLFNSGGPNLGAYPSGNVSPGGMMGNIRLNNLDSGFELQFSKDEIVKNQPDKLVFLDGKSAVTFTERFQIPNEVREALEANQDLVIKPGTYPLTFIDGIFTIKFP